MNGRTITDARMVSGFGQFHTDEEGAKTRTPYVGVTWADITALVDSPQQVPKASAQWLIPSTLPSRTFKRQETEGEFWALWADLDTIPPALQRVVDVLALEVIGAYDFEVYSSRGATADRKKARILIPLCQPLAGADWVLAQQVLNDELQRHGIEPDRKSEGAAQLCYLPNRGEHYEAASQRDGGQFDPLQSWGDRFAAKRQALADAAAAAEAARRAAAARRTAAAARPGGTGGRSLIDAFNAAYSPADILTGAGYSQRGDTFRHPASESGSYSASVRDGRVHSLSSSDPLYTGGSGGGAHDAFSTFCVLEHGGDCDAALRHAGDQMLTIGGESWNAVARREWAQRQPGQGQEQGQPLPEPCADPLQALAHWFVTDEQVEKMQATRMIWRRIVALSHLSVWAAPGNGGKTTLAITAAAELAAAGFTVLFFQEDASAGDLPALHEHARDHGYKLLNSTLAGSVPEDQIKVLRGLARDGADLSQFVMFFDTLKKYADLMSKGGSRDFFQLMRAMTQRGATIILLGHTNKHRGVDGKLIFEGVGDVRNDVDEMFYIDATDKDAQGLVTLTMRPDKVRCAVAEATFELDTNTRQVRALAEVVDVAAIREAQQRRQADAPLIEVISRELAGGGMNYTELLERAVRAADKPRSKVREVLDRYSSEDKDAPGVIWTETRMRVNNIRYIALRPEAAA